MDNNFNLDKLIKVIKDFEDDQPQYNNPEIDKMISAGHKVSELVMTHSMPELRDMNKIKTKHGYIEVNFNRYLEYGKAYIIKKPSIGFDFARSAIDSTEKA